MNNRALSSCKYIVSFIYRLLFNKPYKITNIEKCGDYDVNWSEFEDDDDDDVDLELEDDNDDVDLELEDDNDDDDLELEDDDGGDYDVNWSELEDEDEDDDGYGDLKLEDFVEEDGSIKSYMITYYINESNDVYDIKINDKRLWIMMRVINMICFVKRMNVINNCKIETSCVYYDRFEELFKDNLIYFYHEEREYIQNMLDDGFIRKIFTILDYL
jgi:hypothetical protein